MTSRTRKRVYIILTGFVSISMVLSLVLPAIAGLFK